MQTTPKIGTVHEKVFTVDASRCVDFSDWSGPTVLATPWLIWNLEYAALELLQPYLDDGEMSVGVRVEMDHLSPTPQGQTVICRARVVHAEGPVVAFQVEAHDASDLVARGVHKRRVVSAKRFTAAVQRKQTGPSAPAEDNT